MLLSQEQIEHLFTGVIIEHTERIRPSHKRVVAGGEILVRPYARTRSYAAQLQAGKTATCRVKVLSCIADLPFDVWRMQLQIERTRVEVPRLLARVSKALEGDPDSDRAHGYTDRPSEALGGEPEAIDADTQKRYSTEGTQRHEQRELMDDANRIRGEVTSLEERAQRCEEVAQERGIDVRDDLAVYANALDRARRRLDVIEEKIYGRRR